MATQDAVDVNPISLKGVHAPSHLSAYPIRHRRPCAPAWAVMRLCKPSFSMSPPALSPVEDAWPGVALSGVLALPQSFGDIYLGETFSCYASLCNTSPTSIAHVGLKVEVQTQLQRETLADSSVSNEVIKHFASQQTLDKIIEYDLKVSACPWQ